MRTLALGVLLCLCSGLADAQNNIRQVDFKNFTYPLSGSLLGHDRLQWLDMPTGVNSKRNSIHLVKGEELTKSSIIVMDGREYTQREGFTLESVGFADVTGDGEEDAIVALHYRTGGTQQTDYVYIYSLAAGKPKVLAYFHSGDRGSSGLYKVYGENGALVVELLDPEKKSGDCCSAGFVRTRYKWRNGRFEAFGSREYGELVIEEHKQEP
jgi:hypothetical protein